MAHKGVARGRGKEQIWRRLLRLQRGSGLTIRDFCAEHDVSEPSFFAWRRAIAERDRRAKPQTTGAIRDAGTNSNARTCDAPAGPLKADGQPLFVPLRVVSTSATPSGSESVNAFEVVLTSGRIVRVPANFEAASLRQLVAVLEDLDRCKAEESTADEERPC